MRTWLIAAIVLQLFGPSINKKNREGAELYEEGKLEEALVAYTQAQEESPDASEIQYNIANVHYRKEETDKALGGYRTAQSGSEEVQRRSHFNAGNVHHKGEKFPEAVAAYKEALKIDDQDIEARQNLELSLKKEEEQQQEQDGGGDSGESDENEQGQSQPQNQQNQEQPENQPQPKDQAMDSSDQGGEAQPQGMSKEEAERILAALAEMEKAEQRKQQQTKQIKASASGKDW